MERIIKRNKFKTAKPTWQLFLNANSDEIFFIRFELPVGDLVTFDRFTITSTGLPSKQDG